MKLILFINTSLSYSKKKRDIINFNILIFYFNNDVNPSEKGEILFLKYCEKKFTSCNFCSFTLNFIMLAIKISFNSLFTPY